MPRSVAVMMMLTYVLQVDCKPKVLSSVNTAIKPNLNDLSKNWPGLCSDKTCSNVNVTSTCSGFRMVDVSIQISSLR